MGYPIEFARILLALVLTAAGLAKVTQNRTQRANAILAYGISSDLLARLVAITLPLAEIGVGVCLFTSAFMPLAGFAAAFLFVAFALAMAVNLVNGRVFPCACFTTRGDHVISWRRVALDLTLAVTALFASGSASTAWRLPMQFTQTRTLSLDNALGVGLLALGVLSSVVLMRGIISLSRMPDGSATGQSAGEPVGSNQHHDLDLNAVAGLETDSRGGPG